MAIDVRLLYKIEGKAGPALQRVEEAMEWLLSPKAEGIGEKLLRDAHELHGKPVTIEVAEGLTAYNPPHLGHRINIDPNYITGTTVMDAMGKAYPVSWERTLGHELKHAGQKEWTEELQSKVSALQTDAALKVSEQLPQELQEEMFPLIQRIIDAKDYDTAMKHIDSYVDRIALPMQNASPSILTDHPEFMSYINNIEKPAIDVENQIARLLGEPVREDYLSSYVLGREMLHSTLKGELSRTLKLDKLPGAPELVETKSWTDSITKSMGQELG